jgi:hypothetical protein
MERKKVRPGVRYRGRPAATRCRRSTSTEDHYIFDRD